MTHKVVYILFLLLVPLYAAAQRMTMLQQDKQQQPMIINQQYGIVGAYKSNVSAPFSSQTRTQYQPVNVSQYSTPFATTYSPNTPVIHRVQGVINVDALPDNPESGQTYSFNGELWGYSAELEDWFLIGVDPNASDPGDRMPIGDGIILLLTLAGGYIVMRKRRVAKV